MPIDPTRLCKCHGEAMYRVPPGKPSSGRLRHEYFICAVKRRISGQKTKVRYRQSETGKLKAKQYRQLETVKAAQRKRMSLFSKTPAGRAIATRYSRTEKGKLNFLRNNARQIWAGTTYLGKARTAEDASALNAGIKEKLNEFKQGQQARKEAQGSNACSVRSETTIRTD